MNSSFSNVGKAIVCTLATYAGIHMLLLLMLVQQTGDWQKLNIFTIIQADYLVTRPEIYSTESFFGGYVLTGILIGTYYYLIRKNSSASQKKS